MTSESDAMIHLAECEDEEVLNTFVDAAELKLEKLSLGEREEELRAFKDAVQQKLRKRVHFQCEVEIMQTIFSLHDLQPGQENVWIQTIRDHLDAFPRVDGRRKLLLLLCRLEKHPEATALAFRHLLHSGTRLLSDFFDDLELWAKKRKLSKSSTTSQRKRKLTLFQSLSDQV